MSIKPSLVRAGIRVALFVILTLVLLLPWMATISIAPRVHFWVRRQWSRGVCRILGLKVRAIGSAYRGGPAMYVSNHVSYVDIPVLAPFFDAVFVAKSDVSEWPLFGFLSKWDGTVFVHRVSSRSREQSLHLQELFQRGRNLILFPEGTSTSGENVAPFKTSLFSIVTGPTEDDSIVVQPISVCYVRYRDGTPLVGELSELYCWYGDADLLPHLTRLLGLMGAEVEVRFHDPIPVKQIPNRKELGRISHAVVAEGLAASRSSCGSINAPRDNAAGSKRSTG